MKRFAMLALSVVLLLSAMPAFAQDRNNEDEVVKVDARASQFNYRENEVIVKFKPVGAVQMRANARGEFATSGVNRVDAVMRELGAESFEGLMPLSGKEVARRSARAINGQEIVAQDLSKLYRVRFDAKKVASVQEAIEKLQALDEVEYAEPNYLVYTTAQDEELVYNDPLHSEQWGINAVNLRKLWKVEPITDERPVIGILDTGVEITHPDLAGNAWVNEAELNGVEGVDDDANGFVDDVHGWDFINQCAIVDDYNGHGTHCAGIAAAMAGNEKGGVGANPNALIMSISVMQSDGVGDIATIIKGVDYAAANGVDVLSMSIGTYANSMAFEQALGKAYQKAVLVAAAGNDGLCIYPHMCKNPVTGMIDVGAPMFPAAYTFVLGVQATESGGGLTSFTNYDKDGPIYSNPEYYGEEQLYNYELKAPGRLIMSTYRGGSYKVLNGTSMACPIVAGGISRLLQCKEYESKELLFGDLIHAAQGGVVNFYDTYLITDEDRRPTLGLTTYELNDTIGGDGDMRADAGEVIAFYPSLRNHWGQAKNIKISLEIAENEDQTIVEFIDNDVDFGWDLSSYGKGKAANPIRFKLRDNCVDGRHICLVFRATCDNIQGELVEEFVITAENGVGIGGMLTEDLTLYPNVHYIVTSPLAVPDGVKLTIKPGTVLKFKEKTGINVAKGSLICEGTPDSLITFAMSDLNTGGLQPFNFNGGTLKYVHFDALYFGYEFGGLYGINNAYAENCIFDYMTSRNYLFDYVRFNTCNIYYNKANTQIFTGNGNSVSISRLNFIDNEVNLSNAEDFMPSRNLGNSNSFSNDVKNRDLKYNIIFQETTPIVYTPESPNYFGSSVEEIVREGVYDLLHPIQPTGYGKYDLSNMLTRPVAEAHGIVWKVVVNGYDAQDEYEMLPPLGVGKHKFEVYFNRPMNKAVEPMVAMGVRPPYTQNAISEEGSWNDEGTIYTAYLTITGKTATDGENRIYVASAEDDEYFEIPIENYRYRVNVQAAGSMSTGFAAEAGLGKVMLNWETDEEDFEDLLGYNIKRYTEEGDTTIINRTLIGSQETAYVDYDVVPGTTYYYTISQVTTSLTNYAISNVVAATPLTAKKGDANGSMTVDVADVVTEVAYITGKLQEQVFIFEAADVNTDLDINVLDVVGTVSIIINPSAAAAASLDESAAKYSIEDGIFYIDSPVALGGIQVRLKGTAEVAALEALNSFEFVVEDQGENGVLVLAFSMTGQTIPAGKHALMTVGEGTVSEIALSDAQGRNIVAVDGGKSGLGSIEAAQMQLPYPTTFAESLTIPYVIGKAGESEVRMVMSDLTGRTVDSYETVAGYGNHSYVWSPAGVANGMYLVSLYVDGVLMQTAKVMYNK